LGKKGNFYNWAKMEIFKIGQKWQFRKLNGNFPILKLSKNGNFPIISKNLKFAKKTFLFNFKIGPIKANMPNFQIVPFLKLGKTKIF